LEQIIPGQARLCAAVLLISTLAVPAAAEAHNAQAARAQFVRAEKLREGVSGHPAKDRTRRDYQRAINAYRRVYYLDPASTKAPVSVVAVAELLTNMGRQFEDADSLQAAIGQYKFLLREYPGYRGRPEALFAIAQIYQDDLHQPAQAKPVFQQFLKEYPRGQRADEARQVLAKSKPARKPKPSEVANNPAPGPNSDADLSRLTGIRYWSTPDYSRVALDLDSDITFHSERLRHPDRVIFDLHWTRLAPSLAGKSFAPKAGLLKKVRVSEYKHGEAQLVLEVDDLGTYSAFLLPNPDRLIIDIHGQRQASSANLKPPPARRAKGHGTGEEDTGIISESTSTRKAGSPPGTSSSAKPRQESSNAGTGLKPPARGPKVISDDEEDDGSAPNAASGGRSEVLPRSVKRPSHVVIREGGEEVEAREARPTASGGRSLIRALGLKIGKIVIDPGHGGHDTGTIGPHGLEEKDLVLDVALRLGRLLEQRLGADVVYTRRDDTFVPLETRTAIANQAQADLFVSVHANSSRDPESRGVETYYLNFTTSSDALEVAARENAVSDQSIHQLQQLVKTIALQEKVEESREFAADVQQALYTGLATHSSRIHNRGVKKAPFVVLIGAKMPSILAEISFVSNPQDERKLRSPAYRQRIAQALYRGIARYASGLSGVKVASSTAQGDGQ
jgi:N-acetylmuramoyl-L-alanine amidase